MILCQLTTRRAKPSPLMTQHRSAPPPGTVMACGKIAQRRCSKTQKAVCNDHSRSATDSAALRAGVRNCSACGSQHSEATWIKA